MIAGSPCLSLGEMNKCTSFGSPPNTESRWQPAGMSASGTFHHGAVLASLPKKTPMGPRFVAGPEWSYKMKARTLTNQNTMIT